VTANKLYEIPTASSAYFMLRGAKAPMDNLKLRQAILTAVDRKAISEGLLSGTCASTIQAMPSNNPAYSPDLKDAYKFNVTKAKKLLADAGYPNGINLTMVLGQGTEPPFSIGNAVQAQLAKIGVNVSITTAAPAQGLVDFNAGKYDMYVQSATGQAASAIWYQRVMQPDGLYHLSSGSPAGDQFTAAVNATQDPNLKPAQNQSKWDTVNQMIMDNAWGAPICFTVNGYSFPKNIKNVENMGWTWGNIFDFRYLSASKG